MAATGSVDLLARTLAQTEPSSPGCGPSRRRCRPAGALEQTVRLPFGEFPATWCVGQQIADLAVHGCSGSTLRGIGHHGAWPYLSG